MIKTLHKSVLLEETINNLVVNKSGVYFDGTAGFGGHSAKLLSKLDENGKLICSDKDIKAFTHTTTRFEDDKRVVVYNTSFTNLDILANLEFVDGYDGIMVDLGVSSYQFDDPNAGFTYREDAILDLRMNKKDGYPAYDQLNRLSEEDIARIIYEYGEEKKSRQIARFICERRKVKKIRMTSDLKEIVAKVTPEHMLNKALSRVFQALRIHVNNELEELKMFLSTSVDLLNSGGRIAVITFHSLEDRIVKEFFRYESTDCVCPPGTPICVCEKEQRLKLVNRKPIIASEKEVAENKRSRSAKLRVAEKV